MAGTAGRSGRRPKPTARKALAGNPGKRALNKDEPVFTPIKGVEPPEWFAEEDLPLATIMWQLTTKELCGQGLLCVTDLAVLERWCVAYEFWRRAVKNIARQGNTITGAMGGMVKNPELTAKKEQETEMNDTSGRWSYARQLYGHVYTAKIGTLSELVTAGDQFNQQHITLAGYEKETQTPADELAASRTARAAVFIRNDPARPTQTGELVGMLPAPKGKRFTMTEQQTLLSHGVATAYVESGGLRIQRDVTTYRKNAYGVADNSYLDSETLHTSAYVLRKLKSVITSKYGRHKLASDGTRFGPGQAIVTPAVIKGELLATYRQLERAGIVENYELFKQYLVVERDASDPNRLNTLFPPDYVNQLRVFAVVNQFRLQYSEESA
ncbi:TPA: phage tail sheath subtilisin-like domain-containing protein [Escherichia coli]|nr:hypothetical protein [Escherichia coli]